MPRSRGAVHEGPFGTSLQLNAVMGLMPAHSTRPLNAGYSDARVDRVRSERVFLLWVPSARGRLDAQGPRHQQPQSSGVDHHVSSGGSAESTLVPRSTTPRVAGSGTIIQRNEGAPVTPGGVVVVSARAMGSWVARQLGSSSARQVRSFVARQGAYKLASEREPLAPMRPTPGRAIRASASPAGATASRASSDSPR